MKKSELKEIIRQILQEQEDLDLIDYPGTQKSIASPFSVKDANNFHLLPDNERREIIKRLRQGTLDDYKMEF